jgi:hypothetical protein
VTATSIITYGIYLVNYVRCLGHDQYILFGQSEAINGKNLQIQTRNFSSLPIYMTSLTAKQNHTFKIGFMKLMGNIPDDTESGRCSFTELIHPLFILQNLH